ncbi:hypothetical protein V5N11_029405 [Cardamine amara subsp. amara]|uniref:Uncharacterized protein n=1 Tax=Cardamine amara subsp. amara TaxID=228776 RepID=A0ABD1C130_CARAN
MEDHLRSRNFWALEVRTGDPWNWKSLLKLRHLAVQFLRCDVGNGELSSFWYDVWTPFGTALRLSTTKRDWFNAVWSKTCFLNVDYSTGQAPNKDEAGFLGIGYPIILLPLQCAG